ncbi:Na(+)-translocating NADH-quinone reductase subunit A [Oricola thermophila]|uniref:Na(+)-translocating NADH-quinone reductase subunit A n=1 Tax=Oricola thermophila TaxID=2742145 RepID=UPI0018D9B325|nr:Na(+)-translocating NADH-quinone reductase subunit A [Oricola thermophila]
MAQGEPVLRSRREPEIVVVAPMPARVATIGLGAGHRLSEVVFFHEPDAGRHEHDVDSARSLEDRAALRDALLGSGLWRDFRSRPFGRVPAPREAPSAIVVMALDTRPGAPDPRLALAGRQAEFEHGLRALTLLTDGPVLLCQDHGPELFYDRGVGGRIRLVKSHDEHPWGLAGFQVHRHHPAEAGRPVWDIHAEDVAGIGAFLLTGLVPETRLVSVTGTALREPRLVRCQAGADLRALSYRQVRPGRHSVLAGSVLDGQEARWLGARDRQATVISGEMPSRDHHWFLSALRRASRPLPLIPTAAVDHAMGGEIPAVAFLKAVAVGDTETAIRLGALSLLGEDLALADYVTCAEPRFSELLARMLDRIAEEGT